MLEFDFMCFTKAHFALENKSSPPSTIPWLSNPYNEFYATQIEKITISI